MAQRLVDVAPVDATAARLHKPRRAQRLNQGPTARRIARKPPVGLSQPMRSRLPIVALRRFAAAASPPRSFFLHAGFLPVKARSSTSWKRRRLARWSLNRRLASTFRLAAAALAAA